MHNANDTSDYQGLVSAVKEMQHKEMQNEQRFVPLSERRDTGILSSETIKSLHHGKYMTRWRGVPLLKDPLDLTIIQQLLWDVKPRTVFEFGAYQGASALWLADMLKVFVCESRVLSVDIDLSLLDPVAKNSPDVTFIEGDLHQVEKCFPIELLKTMPHPWFLIEDAHVNLIGVLEYFDKFMEPGDYICVEDTNPLVSAKAGQGFFEGYDIWGPAKLNELRQFLKDPSRRYLVDQHYTDFFGYNATWNMNGFLKRV